MEFLVKVALSALVIAGVSELAKRNAVIAALLISLPLTSILSILWLWRDTRDAAKISALSMNILWAVIPSLLFFVVISQLLNRGVRFPLAMLASCVVMFLAYSLYVFVLSKFGVKI
jgi:uncharacterized membrane protein (GlpM family)